MNTTNRLGTLPRLALTWLTLSATFVLFGSAPGAAAVDEPKKLASGLDGCELVDISKSLGDGIFNNVLNFFKFWGPAIVAVSLIIGLLASRNNRGGPWFRWGIFIFAGLMMIPTLYTTLGNVTSSPCT